MKSFTLSILVFFALPLFVSAQDSLQIENLVAYYPFSGNAEDSSGFENHGQVFGATLTEDRFGNENSAYEFDGVDDLINFGSDSAFNVTGELTLSVWAKGVGQPTGVTALIGKTSFDSEVRGGMAPYGIALDDGDRLYTYIRNNEENLGILYEGLVTDPEEWIHYVSVFKPNEYLKLYRNGELLENVATNVPDSISLEPQRPLVAGARTHTDNLDVIYYFDGALDDIRIYSKALSDTLVKDLYSENGWPETKYVISDTLVAYYPFNGNAKDSSGFGNDGEVFGATLTQDRFGNENSAYEFDGVDDYIVVSDADYLTPTNHRLSISVWFKTQFPGDRFILYKGSSTSNREYAMGVRIDSVGSFQINQGGSLSDNDHVRTETVLEKNTWNHLVGVWDSSSIRIYLNNKLEDEHSTDKRIDNFGSDLFIGTYGGAISQYAFNGTIDDVRIYKTSLDSAFVDSLYNIGGWPETEYYEPELPDTLVAYYPFSGNTKDSSGFENDGEVFGATLAQDRFGNENSAYRFDGNSDKIYLPEDFDFPERTISVWLKAEEISVLEDKNFHQVYISDHPNIENGMTSIWVTNFDDKDNICFHNGGADVVLDNCHEIEKQEWNLATVSVTQTEIKHYLNGELLNSIPYPGNIHSVTDNGFFSAAVGVGRNTNHRFFDGVLDDIRIYNYVVSDSVIKNLFLENDWVSPNDTTNLPDDVLVGYYLLDGNAADSSGFGNDGTVVGASLAEDRFNREGMAYEFDGIDDFIRIDNPEKLHSQKNLSFSFWGKGISPDSTFRSFISTVNNDPFNFAIDDGDRLLFGVQTREIPLNLIVEDLITNPDKWYHYGAVYRANEYLRIYRDGIEIGSLYGTIPKGTNLTSEEVFFGANVTRTESSEDIVFFEGSLDEIRFYNHHLSDDQVDSVFVEESKTPVSSESENFIPEEFKLYQNYPNPFNPSTVISFDIPENGLVSLKVYDLTGRLVATIIDNNVSAGRYQLTFNAARLSSGVYFYELKTNSFSSVKKFTLIK